MFLRSGGQVDISYYLILSAFIMDRHAFYFHLDAGVMPPCPSRIELGGGGHDYVVPLLFYPK